MYKESFLEYLRSERHYSPLTVSAYRASLDSFESYMGQQDADIDWSKVNAGDIREWIVSLMRDGSAATTVNARLSALRSFFRYLLSYDYVAQDPTYMVAGPKKAKPLPKFLRESELDKLFERVEFGDDFRGRRDYMILLMLYSTGIRLAELVGMNVGDMDFGARTLRVIGKRNKERQIPFGDELETTAHAYLDARSRVARGGEPAFYIDEAGQRITRNEVQYTVKHYLSLVTTMKGCTPHVLRHTFATQMLNHGADIESVKELLGHDSLASTQVYTHTTFEELRRTYECAHPRA